MKKLEIQIHDQYKSYKKDTTYELEGDLIILSGVNGSGKSQLLKIIAKNGNEVVNRSILQTADNGVTSSLENILLLSFRDNINFGKDFGQFSVSFQQNNMTHAWNFYNNNIKHGKNTWSNDQKTKNYQNNSLILNSDGTKNPSWRSILKLMEIIDNNYVDEKKFNLSQDEFETIIPNDFIWRNENDIIQLVGNLFYMACCDRANTQIKFSETTEVFDNEKWLENAPWTILNQLFEKLKFKYRFKTDYLFKMPNMEENPKLRDSNEIRSLLDLSDGEKTILKLALIALDEEISNDISLVLFDEYEAPLNPSLIEAFYHVINEFYIKNNIQVIITTHSPATLSLAPEYAQFYEIFSQKNNSPKIVKVNQYDYEELKKANKTFYDKLKNQEKRIAELEQVSHFTGNMLLVEDKYDQIYKIAYLKTKGIDNITEANFEQKFTEHSFFSIHGGYSTGGLYNVLSCPNTSHDENNKTICLFDFDTEGYEKFRKTLNFKPNSQKVYSSKQGSIRTGLFSKHEQVDRYALMIPIPERLEKYVSEKSSSDCFIEIESLLSENYLKKNDKAEKRSLALPFYKMKDNHKNDFWKDLFDTDKEYFEDFKPLFTQIETIFNNS